MEARTKRGDIKHHDGGEAGQKTLAARSGLKSNLGRMSTANWTTIRHDARRYSQSRPMAVVTLMGLAVDGNPNHQ